MTEKKIPLHHRMIRSALQRRGTTMVITIVAIILGLLGARRIQPSPSLRSMLADDEPAAQALATIGEEFATLDELIIVATVSNHTNVTDLEARTLLQTFGQRLSDHIEQSPELSTQCTSVLYAGWPQLNRFIEETLIPNALLYMDDEAYALLKNKLTKQQIDRQISANETLITAGGPGGQALSKAILKDPLRIHSILSSQLGERFDGGDLGHHERLLLSLDGRSLMIRISGKTSAQNIDFSKLFVSAIRQVITQVNVDHLTIEMTGGYAIAVVAESAMRTDMTRSITTSMVLLGILFVIVYRHILSFALAVAPVAIGILCGFGLSSFYSTALTPVVAVVGAVLAGLGIDYSIHFLSHAQAHQDKNLSPEQTSQHTAQRIAPALAAACVTSIIGFLAISQSSVPALRQFSVVGALGLICTLIASLTVLPVLLTYASRWRNALPQPRLLDGLLTPIIVMVARRPVVSILCVLLPLTLVAGLVSVKSRDWVKLETDLSVMHPRPNEPLTLQHTLSDRFGQSPHTLIVLLESESEPSLVALAYDVKQKLQDTSVQRVGVTNTLSLATFLPDDRVVQARLQQVNRIDADRVIKDFKSAINASLFDPEAYSDYSNFLQTLLTTTKPPTIRTLHDYPQLSQKFLPRPQAENSKQRRRSLLVAMIDAPLHDRHARDESIRVIRRALATLPGATLTGISVVGYDTERAIQRDLKWLLTLAAMGVCIWLWIYFRSVSALVLSLLPSIFGLIVLLLTMNLLDMSINAINIVALPVLVGIGVDDGIFLVSLARRRFTDHSVDHTQSLIPKLATASHAVTMTTLSTIIGFGSLATTSTPAMASLGIVLAIGMAACLLGTLAILAPLLVMQENRINRAVAAR